MAGKVGMPRYKDRTGQKFGLLTAVERVGTDKHRKAVWLFKCDCGKDVTRTLGRLISGKVKSCGCAQYSLESNKKRGKIPLKKFCWTRDSR